MMITDLQCQIKLHFAYMISSFYKWKLPTDSPTWRHWWWTLHKLWLWKIGRVKNHWEGKAVTRAEQIWLIFDKLASHVLNLIIYWACEDKETFPHKEIGGEVLLSLRDSPSFAGTTVRGTEQKVPLVKSCYMCGVLFLLHLYCSLFLMNGNLTFSLVEQGSICSTALQNGFAPSLCLFFPSC